ncbi:ATP-binding protein [Candidatus Saccharibacteria bacterium]|nr:ATP-binding protein [Candidatus Saccharibacteria bacterium]
MDVVFSILLGILGKWYIWLPIVAVLAYFTWQNNRKATTVQNMEHTLLVLEIPRANDKQELAAEQMFASLHGILRSPRELRLEGALQEHISFEIASIEKHIRFYVWVPKHLQNFVEGQIYAQYPTVQIHEADEDYADRDIRQSVIYSAELGLIDNEVLPIKSFQTFDVDPLAAITATLAKLDDPGEEMWIQVMARPIADTWHKRSAAYISRVKSGGGDGFMTGAGWVKGFFEALWKPPEPGAGTAKELSEREKTRLAEAEKKSTKLGYQVKIRLVYVGNDKQTARLRMQAIVGTFKQYNSTNLNGFTMKNPAYDREALAQAKARFFIDKGIILNIEELASLYHLPHTNVETPNIVWASSKTAEPPAKLPVLAGTPDDNNISAFGLTNFRGYQQQFGMYRSDRGRHIYIIGQTGAGKSGLLELFALSDIFHNQGYAIIDPHGDFAVNNMKFIPAHRIKDVVYFNPADTAFPVGFNPMEVINPNMKNNISSEIIGVLKRMFGDSWGPRLEYILRYTILALLDYPDSTMLDITRMLTDKKFRKDVLGHVTDSVVLNFWNIEFASWQDKFASEAVAPVLNKVGAFTANPIIRNIIGQPKSTFNIRQIMDEGKILIVNLSKGLIGEDNASILGSFLVTKIQLAAMSRSDIPNVEDRRPFYLYVDEFQNFATDSFATILSEARKYGLNLTVANQYTAQMSDVVRSAVFGNVGTMISFRVSADDAPVLSKPFEPQFLPEDLLQMNNRHFIVSMVIKGEKTPAFSATTLALPANQTDLSAYIIENTRRTFGRPHDEVKAEIQALMNPTSQQLPAQAGGGNNGGGGGNQAPKSSAQQKKWPVDDGAKKVAPAAKTTKEPIAAIPAATRAATAPQAPSAQQPETPRQERSERSARPAPAGGQSASGDEGGDRPKRKRSRSRSRGKNKGGEGGGDAPRAASGSHARPEGAPQAPPRTAPAPASAPARPAPQSGGMHDGHELILR